MEPTKKESPLSDLLFDDVEKINHDQDYLKVLKFGYFHYNVTVVE